MKIGGVTVSRCEEVLVLPRTDGDLVFKAAAILSMDEFDTLCPKPVPAMKLVKGGKEADYDAKDYVAALKVWGARRYAYICVKSLEPSDIEWDTVDMEKCETWENWTADMEKSGLASTEINRISTLILEANALSEAKLIEARESFLLGQGTA